MLSRSLYVGMITRAFSGNRSSLLVDACPDHQQNERESDECDDLALFVRGIDECELDVSSSLRQWDADQCVVRSSRHCTFSINGCFPSRKIILAYYQG